MKKLTYTILASVAMSAAFVAPSSATGPYQVQSPVVASPVPDQGPQHAFFRVVGVAYNDVLNMRSGPGTSNQIVNVLYPQQQNVRIRFCSNYVNWCKVDAGYKVGWVNMRYLIPVNPY